MYVRCFFFNSDYENQNLNPQDGGTVADCDSVTGRRPEKDWDKACKFDLTANLGADCIKQQTFGFDDGMPCILLKLNKVFYTEEILLSCK